MFRIAAQLDYNSLFSGFIALSKALHGLPEIILQDGKRLAGREDGEIRLNAMVIGRGRIWFTLGLCCWNGCTVCAMTD